MTLSITYQQWMLETKRGLLTTRSRELKAVDDALSRYEGRAKSGGDVSFNLLQLNKALQDWLQLKSDAGQDWRASTRNLAPGGMGKGIVEKLVDEVADEMENKDYDETFTFIRRDVVGHYHQGASGVQSGFVSFGGSIPAAAGWKFHVSAPLDKREARKAADEVLPLLRQRNFWHKIPKNMTNMNLLYRTEAERGKFITIYSKSPDDAHEIAITLFSSDWARGYMSDAAGNQWNRSRVGAILGDVQINGLENAYCRYGSYKGSLIPGPEPATAVRDNRSCGWPPWLPGWGKMAAKGQRDYPPASGKEMSWDQAIACVAEKGRVKHQTAINISGY